jgi:hypothetical protein
MAQTLLSGNISTIYDKLIFTKGDGKLYYSDTSGDADTEFTQVTLDTELAAWTGTTNVVTLGTIGTGTWSASTIAVNKGGSGQTSYTNGQLLIGNTSGNTLAKATLTGTNNEIEITNGAGAITIGIPSAPTLTGTTTVNGKIILQNGATIDNSTAGDCLTFKSESKYRYEVTDGVGDLIIELAADGGGSQVDVNRIRSADGGTIYFENYEGGSYSTSFSIDKSGNIKIGTGGRIQNSDGEAVLYLTADQKLQITGGVIQNTDNEDVITIGSDQSVNIAGTMTVTGDSLTFPNSGGNSVSMIAQSSGNTLKISADNIAFGGSTSTASLNIFAANGEDSVVKYTEASTTKWTVGNDGTDDSFRWSSGSSLGSGSDRLTLTQAGELRVYGTSGNDAIVEMRANAAATNSKSWKIIAKNATDDISIQNKISGSYQEFLSVKPHTTPASSSVTMAGTAIAPIVQTDTISEKTADNGVVIDGVTMKDNKITSVGSVYTTAGIFPMSIPSIFNGSRLRFTNDAYTYIGTTFYFDGVLNAAKLTGVGMSAYDFKAPLACKIKTLTVGVVFDAAVVYRLRIYKGTVTNGDTQMDSLTQLGSDILFNSSSVVTADVLYEQIITLDASLSVGDRIYSAWMCDSDVGVMAAWPNIEYFIIAP